MRIYAHRANLEGPGSGDNSLDAIRACLDRGFGVEIDIWGRGGELRIGHDAGGWQPTPSLLSHPDLIAHAKDVDAVELLRPMGVVFFCLDRDPFALCSDGRLWVNYGSPATPRAIMCSPELVGSSEDLAGYYARIAGCHGVCTDFPVRYHELVTCRPAP